MKNFRLMLICAALIFLDMPSPLRTCSDDRTTLLVTVQVVDDDSINFVNASSKIDYHQTFITDSMVKNCLSSSLKSGTVFNEEEGSTYKIEVKSYNIESFVLTKNDHSEIEITLPYEFKEEDIIVYESGRRNFLKVTVRLTVEYDVVIPENDAIPE